MFSDALNPIIAKKRMKENWKIKGKIIYQKRDYYKVKIITNEGEISELKNRSRWKISNKVIYLKNRLVLSFSLIIFIVGMREWFKKYETNFFFKSSPIQRMKGMIFRG